MTERDRLYLEHILDCISRIESYTGPGRDAFHSRTIIQDSVVRNLHLIGESSKRISDEVRQAVPAIPWKDIAGLRNVLVHDYLGIDLDLVWDIVSKDLADLKCTIEGFLRGPF